MAPLLFVSALALLFIALKLTGMLAWSWWGVLAPLWGTAVFVVLVVVGTVAWVFGRECLVEWRVARERRDTHGFRR